MDERNPDVELMHEPQASSRACGTVGRRNQPCQRIGGAMTIVVNVDHDAVRRGPDTDRCRGVAIQQGVGDDLGGSNQQIVKDRLGQTATADQRKGAAGRGWRAANELDQGGGLFERVRRCVQALELRDILVAAAGVAVAGGRNDPGVGSCDGIEDRGGQWSQEEEEAFRAPIRSKYEEEGSPYFATARLWDDGIITPRETRRVLGLALAAALNAPIPEPRFGVFRM